MWTNPLRTLSWWPSTTRQAVGNPLQADRLPDASGVELEYPARGQDRAAARRHARVLLLLAALLGLGVGVTGLVVQGSGVSFLFLGVVSVWSFYAFTTSDAALRRGRWARPVNLVLGPLLAVAFFVFREPVPHLLACILASVRLSDLFATHYFTLKTTAPLPRTRALHLRSLWSRRMWGLLRTAKGLELYAAAGLGIVAVLAFAYLRDARHRMSLVGDSRYLDSILWLYLPEHGGSLLLGLFLLLALPLAAEPAIAFLFARRAVGPRTMARAFGEALVDWLTYNRQGATAAGVFRSPAGTYRERRRMTLATVALLACLMVQFSSRERNAYERVRGLGEMFWGEAAARGPTTPDGDPSPRLVRVAYRPQGPPLEPWQEALLRRMGPEERAEYLGRLRERRAREEAAEAEAKARADAEARGPGVLPETVAGDWRRYRRLLFTMLPARYPFYATPLFLAAMPLCYALACCFATTARVAGFWSQEFRAGAGERLLNTETWGELVDRVRSSRDRIEQESLLLGVNAHDDSPVIVPRAVFREHAHLLGDSGSGKTSLGIASLLTQFIRFGDCSVVVVDLKGDDLALMEGARIEAERAGSRFRWFSNELGRSTYAFNPLTQSHLPGLTLYQRTDILTAALGLQYGSDYGRGYFSDANAELLFHALKSRPAGIASFGELAAVLRERAPFRGVPEDLKAAGAHLTAILNRLADTRALNATAGDGCPDSAMAHAIDMPEVFRTPQVLYFHLASAIGMASTAEIARLALYSLLTAAKAAQGERRQVYLFIDEFQRIVSNNLELFLQQARSLDIGVILANQTLGDLKTAGVDLIPTVRANTRFRQIFAASDLVEQDEIVRTSGETRVLNRSWKEYVGSLLGAGSEVSVTEVLTPRLRVNDVLLATDHPMQSIVQIRRGHGYAQFGGFPFVMTSAFHIDEEEYRRRKRAPWPEREGETLTPTLAPAPARPDPQPPAESPLVGPPEVIAPGVPAADAGPGPSPPPREEPAAADPFAALKRHQEEKKRARTRKPKGHQP